MRILLLCDRYPNSYRDGLLLRVLHLAKRLREDHEIDLLCYHKGSVDGAPTDIFSSIWCVQPPENNLSRGWWGMVTGWNPYKLYPHSSEVVRLLKEEIDPKNYDLVWDAGASLFLHLPTTWNEIPLVADLVDDMVLTFWRAMSSTSGLIAKLRIFKYLTVNLLYERYCMRRVAHCVVVSEEDAAMFHRVSSRVPVTVIQNGVDIDFFTPGCVAEVPGRLVFEGSMAFPPNRQAALFLVNEIMPCIWIMNPSVTLTLVGRDPAPDICALASDRVFVTGAVEDIRPYVREAKVFVCPLRSGAGIKNKLLQAWAMNKAIVATSISVGGLGAIDGDNLIIRDDASEIASAVIALLDNPDEITRLGTQGREKIISSFSWEKQSKLFQSLLTEAKNDPIRERCEILN